VTVDQKYPKDLGVAMPNIDGIIGDEASPPGRLPEELCDRDLGAS
jgi:hypothetical protein